MIDTIDKNCDNCRYNLSTCFNEIGNCKLLDKWQPKEDNQQDQSTRTYNIGNSDYSKHKIQPWDIWLEYNLNPWDADIIKRVLRTKKDNPRKLDYEKIKHICDERLRQLNLE